MPWIYVRDDFVEFSFYIDIVGSLTSFYIFPTFMYF